jgi:hypothetical protein
MKFFLFFLFVSFVVGIALRKQKLQWSMLSLLGLTCFIAFGYFFLRQI